MPETFMNSTWWNLRHSIRKSLCWFSLLSLLCVFVNVSYNSIIKCVSAFHMHVVVVFCMLNNWWCIVNYCIFVPVYVSCVCLLYRYWFLNWYYCCYENIPTVPYELIRKLYLFFFGFHFVIYMYYILVRFVGSLFVTLFYMHI